MSQSEIRTEPRPNCPLCGSLGRSLYRDLPSALFETPGRWDFSQCPHSGCGMIWMNPVPVEADLHRAYETYFTHGEDTPKQKTSLRDILYTAYRAANYPCWWLAGIAREKARCEQMFLEEITPGRLLDVGCGDGRFLNRMRGRGWSVDGVDFDAAAVQAARRKYNLDLRHGDLRRAGFAENTFDAVTMSHVIEHIVAPIKLLTEISKVLKPGGLLVMTTPNTESLGHGRFGPCWFGVDAPRHLDLYSPRTLARLAQHAGFETVRAASTPANADVFAGASYTLQENSRHRMGHQPPPSILRTLKAAWWQYREHFALAHDPACGEEAVFVGRKPTG